jgi:hypothetical protein
VVVVVVVEPRKETKTAAIKARTDEWLTMNMVLLVWLLFVW